MAPLPTGACDTCDEENVKLRTNPFDDAQQCEDCRKDTIIGITDLKKEYKLKDNQLEGLQMVKEAKPKFVGGPDHRWYLVKEVKARTEEEEKKLENGDAKKGNATPKSSAKKDKAADAKKKTPVKTPTKSPEETKAKETKTKEVKRKRDSEEEASAEDEVESAITETEPPAKKGRGRPRKNPPKAPVVDDGKPKRGRGRPPKAKKAEE